jgi:membrane protein DedA with SNARE-associated domain
VNDLPPLVLNWGYVVLFAFVCAEQIGLPVPAVPVLLGIGALAGTGRMSIALALGVALAASLPADLVWYEVGRRRGGRVLGLICRLSLEPDSCVRSTENLFARRGVGALVVAKFFPGLSTLAPPLAGIVGIARSRFVVLDMLGAVVWAGAWLGVGYLFRDALDTVVALAGRVGSGGLVLAATALVAWVVAKFFRRWSFVRRHRMARITADELKGRIDAGDPSIVVIDTRSAIDAGTAPFIIRGALRIPAEEIDRRHDEVPRDRDVVLYCT